MFGRFWFRFPNGESGADVYDRITLYEDHLTRDMLMVGGWAAPAARPAWPGPAFPGPGTAPPPMHTTRLLEVQAGACLDEPRATECEGAPEEGLLCEAWSATPMLRTLPALAPSRSWADWLETPF